VSQISPPIRIALLLTVAVLGAYMLFLRPKTEVAAPPAKPAAPNVETDAPAVSAPGKAAEKAQEAVKAANRRSEKAENATGEEGADTAAGTTTGAAKAKPGTRAAAAVDEELKGLPKPVAAALSRHKVLVLLFWNGKSADDKAVHAALKHVDRWDGRVSVQSAAIRDIAKYGRIARGVDVEQSPTVVVADPQLRAETLVGYVDAATIDQAVVDAFRNSTGLFTSAYLRKADAVCVEHSNVLARVPNFYGGGSMRKADARLTTVDKGVARFIHDFRAVKAPKRWKAYHAAALADLAAFDGILSRYAGAVTPSTSLVSLLAAERHYKAAARPVSKRLNQRFDRQGLFRCGSDF
jgi:hypothetical protein